MVRPRCPRKVREYPGSTYFKPVGIPLAALEEVVLTLDEFESLRLGDLEGLYHEKAAEHMGISRQTFGRIIESAHRKVADSLVNGKALKIEGGDFEMIDRRKFLCGDCRHEWEMAYGEGKPGECPSCKSPNIQRTLDDAPSPKCCRRRSRHGHCRGQQQK